MKRIGWAVIIATCAIVATAAGVFLVDRFALAMEKSAEAEMEALHQQLNKLLTRERSLLWPSDLDPSQFESLTVEKYKSKIENAQRLAKAAPEYTSISNEIKALKQKMDAIAARYRDNKRIQKIAFSYMDPLR
jgi:hypothetical protein